MRRSARLWPEADGLLQRLDEDGRSLGEASAGVSVRRVACPYSDGRAGRLMNADAFDQVRMAFRDVLQLMSAAAARHPPTVLGAWHALSHCMALEVEEPTIGNSYEIGTGF